MASNTGELNDGWKLCYSSVEPSTFAQAAVAILKTTAGKLLMNGFHEEEGCCMLRLKVLSRSICLIQV